MTAPMTATRRMLLPERTLIQIANVTSAVPNKAVIMRLVKVVRMALMICQLMDLFELLFLKKCRIGFGDDWFIARKLQVCHFAHFFRPLFYYCHILFT